jgi:hypothetical protein
LTRHLLEVCDRSGSFPQNLTPVRATRRATSDRAELSLDSEGCGLGPQPDTLLVSAVEWRTSILLDPCLQTPREPSGDGKRVSMFASDPARAALRWQTSVRPSLPHLGRAFPRRRRLASAGQTASSRRLHQLGGELPCLSFGQSAIGNRHIEAAVEQRARTKHSRAIPRER